MLLPSGVLCLPFPPPRVQSEERRSIAALDSERSEARRVIGEHSEVQAQRLMGLWDSEAEAVAAAVAAEFEPQLRAIARDSDAAISDSTAVVRGIARQIAAFLATRASSEYSAHLAPAVARLEAQRANHARVAPRLMTIRAQVLKALQRVREGRDGDGTSGPHGGGGEDLRPLIEPFPLLVDALPNAAPNSGVAAAAAAIAAAASAAERAIPGSPTSAASAAAAAAAVAAAAAAVPAAVRPPADVYAKLEEQDAASVSLPVPAARRELHALLQRVVSRWLGLPGSDPEDACEALRDSQQAVTGAARPPMKLPRGEAGLPFSVFGRGGGGAGGGGGGAGSAARMAAGIEEIMRAASMAPDAAGLSGSGDGEAGGMGGGSDGSGSGSGAIPLSSFGDVGGPRVVDVAREYRREAERVLASEQIASAEAKLGQLLQDRRRAEASLTSVRHRRGSSADVRSALEATRAQIALEPEIRQLETWLAEASALYRERFGATAALNQDGLGGIGIGLDGDGGDDGSGSGGSGGNGSGGGRGGMRSRPLDLEPPVVPLPPPAEEALGLPLASSAAAAAAAAGYYVPASPAALAASARSTIGAHTPSAAASASPASTARSRLATASPARPGAEQPTAATFARVLDSELLVAARQQERERERADAAEAAAAAARVEHRSHHAGRDHAHDDDRHERSHGHGHGPSRPRRASGGSGGSGSGGGGSGGGHRSHSSSQGGHGSARAHAGGSTGTGTSGSGGRAGHHGHGHSHGHGHGSNSERRSSLGSGTSSAARRGEGSGGRRHHDDRHERPGGGRHHDDRHGHGHGHHESSRSHHHDHHHDGGSDAGSSRDDTIAELLRQARFVAQQPPTA